MHYVTWGMDQSEVRRGRPIVRSGVISTSFDSLGEPLNMDMLGICLGN